MLRATHELNRRLVLRAGTAPSDEDAPVLTYVCRPGERAYLHPLHRPGGGPVLTQDRPSDHPWQHGVFTGFRDVGGIDFWGEQSTPPDRRGSMRFERLIDLAGDDGAIVWRGSSAWLNPNGDRLLTETQAYTVRRGDAAAYTIDLVWTLRPTGNLVLARHDYGGLSVRPIFHAGHEHVNADGDRGASTAGVRSAWCDVSAPYDGSRTWTAEDTLAGAWHGIAVFDHPQNPTYPTPWRVDGQGLINPSPCLAGDLELVEGEETSFAYRLVVHAGRADPDHLNRLHEEFAEEAILTTEY